MQGWRTDFSYHGNRVLFGRLVAHTPLSSTIHSHCSASCGSHGSDDLGRCEGGWLRRKRCVTAFSDDDRLRRREGGERETSGRVIAHPHERLARKMRRKDKEMQELTSGDNPYTTLRDCELRCLCFSCRVDLDHDFALVHEEAHLHLPAVLRSLFASRRQFDKA